MFLEFFYQIRLWSWWQLLVQSDVKRPKIKLLPLTDQTALFLFPFLLQFSSLFSFFIMFFSSFLFGFPCSYSFLMIFSYLFSGSMTDQTALFLFPFLLQFSSFFLNIYIFSSGCFLGVGFDESCFSCC